MKNKLLFIVFSFLFISCSYRYRGKEYTESDFIDLRFVTVGIRVDKHTDVLYWYGDGATLPIFKADGTCLTLTEWKNQRLKMNADERRIE